jgi:hypothetical protein
MARTSVAPLECAIGGDRPLVRWTVGDVRPAGFATLAESVRCWTASYGDRCDRLICYNTLSPAQVAAHLDPLGVPLYRQAGDELPAMPRPPVANWRRSTYPKGPAGAWKLCPPRARPQAHEIVMDNDCLVTRPLPQVDAFLAARDRVLCTEDIHPHRDHRGYGRLARLAAGPAWNSGLYGLYPGFDLGAALPLGALGGRWGRYFDEQGLVGIALQREAKVIIPRRQVGYVLGEGLDRPVLHFVGVNHVARHPYWARYRAARGQNT